MNEQTVNSTTAEPKFKLDGNGILASVFLAFLTTAGIFYINIMPALVSGLKEGLDFTSQQAGFVSSANLYGASIGAFSAVFLVKKINWRLYSFALMISIIAIDLACIFITNADMMIAIRGLHGVVGGLLVGIGFSIISRTAEPDKTFGYLLFIQWGLGGLGLMFLPGLVPEYGTAALFLSLVTFTVVSFIMLIFLPDYPVPEKPEGAKQETKLSTANLKLLGMTLLAIFLFQGANMGLFAYMISLGKEAGLTIEFMSPSLATASWVALLGAFLVMLLGTKYGRVKPLTIGILITAACTWALHYSEISDVYLYTNIIIGVGWAFVLPYLFGICSELDKSGQYAAMGGFASKMGLASGPMVCALILSNENYAPLINLATVSLIACALIAIKPSLSLQNR